MGKNHHNSLLQQIGLPKIPVSSIKALLKDEVGFIYTSVGGLGSSVLGAVFWLVIASLLSVDNYGLLNYYIALATIFSGIGIVGLNMTVTTYLAKGEKHVLYEANSLIFILGIVITAVLSLFEWSAGLLSIALTFFAMTTAELLGRKAYKEYAFATVGQRIAQICLSLLLYYQIGVLGIIAGYLIGSLIFSYRYLFSLRKLTLNFSTIKARRNFAVHSYGYNLVGISLSNYLDKIFVGALFGYYLLGLYQISFQFFMFLGLIPTSLQQYLLPEEASGTNRRQLKMVGIFLAIGAAVSLFILGPTLISRFFPAFSEAIVMVSIMSLTVIPSTVIAIFTATYLAHEKSKVVFISAATYIIALIITLTILGSVMGAIGLAISVVMAKTIQALYLVTQRKSKPSATH